MVLLMFPYADRKTYNATRPINNGLMSMDIISSEPNEIFKIAIRINDTHYIVTPKNEIAQKDFRNWFENNFRKDDFAEEGLKLMEDLIRDNSRFDLLEKVQAYKEFVGIRAYNALTLSEYAINPLSRPHKSFPLLKDWYSQCWEMAKVEKQKTLDNSLEAITVFEIEFIKKNILDTDKLYFPEKLTPGAAEKPYSSEKGSNIAFRKWLIERKTDLEKVKFDPSVSAKQDVEELTEEKLEQYGFDKEMIERLFTWEKYECQLMNNMGYFWASNIEKKIYSGIAGKEKHFSKSLFPRHHKVSKEKFETFDELFGYAVRVGSINISERNYQFSYKTEEGLHNLGFNIWLQNYKGWEYGNEIAYKELLTRENWVAYLSHCQKEENENKQRAENLKLKWQPSGSQLQPKGAKKEQQDPEIRSTPLPEAMQIIFSKAEINDKLFDELKVYFPEREPDLKKSLNGEVIEKALLFPHNQNKFVEVFRRLKYNGFILSTHTEIRDWLCKNFQFRYKRGNVEEIRSLNTSSVWDLLTKAKGEPRKTLRICQPDWLPYKSPGQIQTETYKEQI